MTIDLDKPVRVFINHERGCYSIMQRGVVRASAREVLLREVELRVNPRGRERMLRERRRVVHAFAVGLLVDHVHAEAPARLAPLDGRPVTYDPYRSGAFFDRETLTPVLRAPLAQLDHRGLVCVVEDDPPLREAA